MVFGLRPGLKIHGGSIGAAPQDFWDFGWLSRLRPSFGALPCRANAITALPASGGHSAQGGCF
jgi:hypothetical protein